MIVLSLGKMTCSNCLKTIRNYDFCEIRLDLNDYTYEEIKAIFSTHKKLIATYRHLEVDETKSIESVKAAINSGAAYVDIELGSDENYKKKIMEIARRNNCKIIISHHDSRGTPSLGKLEGILEKAVMLSPDIIKIVGHSTSYEDNMEISKLYESKPELKSKLVAFNTGEIGSTTRTIMMDKGGPFTYACLDEDSKTAEGQIDYVTMSFFEDTGNWNKK